MLRIVARRFGPPIEVLTCEPASPLEPQPSGVVVKMLVSAINPSDLVAVTGAYVHRTPLPFIPGFEGVGVIHATGANTSGLRVGQRILPLGSAGGWQCFKALEADWCIPVPDDLTDEQAATAYVNPLTARLMLRSLAPAPGSVIGVNAAASAIGRMLLRLLHAAGIRSIAIVRSERAKVLLGDESVSDVVIDGQPLPTLDGGFDAVGGDSGALMARAIRRGGFLMHYGLLSGIPLPVGLTREVEAVVKPFWLRNWVHSVPRAVLRAAMTEAFDDIRSGLARTAIEARYPLDEVRAAMTHNALPQRRGKLLFVPA